MKLFVALPVYRELDAFFTQCLVRLISDPPCNLMLRLHPGDSLVSRARNMLTADFLASDATDLLFIDTDLIFSNDHIKRIASHDCDVVGGFYPKKMEGPIQWVCNGCFEPQPIQPDGLQRVRFMGTGFIRIRRCVFERMIEAYPELLYKPDNRDDRLEHDFWSVGVYRGVYRGGDGPSPLASTPSPLGPCASTPGRYLSEDWFFCQRWLDIGGQVFGDTRIVLKHVGQAVYPLKSQEGDLSNPQSILDAADVDPRQPAPAREVAIAPAPAPDHSHRGGDVASPFRGGGVFGLRT